MKILILTSQYPTDAKPDTNPAVLYQERGLRRLGVSIETFFVDRARNGPLAHLRSFIPLRRKWREGAYDLMHVQFGGVQALIGAIIAGRRTVITYHGTDLHGGNPQTWLSRLLSRVNVWCSRRAACMAGGVAVVSPNLLSFLPNTATRRVPVFPPGVDYTLFRPQPVEQERAELGLDINARYILFSDISGSPAKRRDIAFTVEKMVRVHEPEARLLLLTRQPYWRVPLYLNAADCLLLTSEKEGSPNIVKEALAVDLPIVSVDVGDVALRCEGVPNCQIVSRNENDLAEAVLRALTTGREGGGRELKRPEIDNERICEQVCLYYQEVLGLVKGNGKQPE